MAFFIFSNLILQTATKNLFLFLLTGNIKNKDFIEGADVHRDQRQKILNNALAEAKSMAKVF